MGIKQKRNSKQVDQKENTIGKEMSYGPKTIDKEKDYYQKLLVATMRTSGNHIFHFEGINKRVCEDKI
jgi:hypothetical protein